MLHSCALLRYNFYFKKIFARWYNNYTKHYRTDVAIVIIKVSIKDF